MLVTKCIQIHAMMQDLLCFARKCFRLSKLKFILSLLLLATVWIYFVFPAIILGLGAKTLFQADKAVLDRPGRSKPLVVIGMSICGSRLEEGLVSLKSLVMFSRNVDLDVRIFRDNDTEMELLPRLQEMGSIGKSKWGTTVKFQIYKSWFPSGDGTNWARMFKPCSTQRLFYPSLLPDVDAILHLDSDTLLLSDILELWSYFNKMNSTQLAGMAQEDELPGHSWYDLNAKTPYYKPRGLNAGVMLMNLTRMREKDFENMMRLTERGFRKRYAWADQDLMNIYFQYNRHLMYQLPCEFNYRTQHCQCRFSQEGRCRCKKAEKAGISILHGSRNMFFESGYFSSWVYDAIAKFNLSTSTAQALRPDFQDIKVKMGEANNCSNLTMRIFNKFFAYHNLVI